MRTDHIAAFAAAAARGSERAGDSIARREAELDDARRNLAHAEATIRVQEAEMARLALYRQTAIEHVQELEVELDRWRRRREACDGVLIVCASPPPGLGLERGEGSGVGSTVGRLAPAGDGQFTKHLGRNGAA